MTDRVDNVSKRRRDLKYLLCIMLLFLFGCSDPSVKDDRQVNSSLKEKISRKSSDISIQESHYIPFTREPYSWEKGYIGKIPVITKEFFRCKGNSLREMKTIKNEDNAPTYFFDCGGYHEHSLPIRNGREFVYPVLIELLNFVQIKTQKEVVITSGHRCPKHNSYLDESFSNQYSKHLIGAEVDFYVKGMEQDPQDIIELLMKYYQEMEPFKEDSLYAVFHRYDGSTNVTTKPWFNREVFIKFAKAEEGRNLDNQHLYPYITIQVRYDRDLEKRVLVEWDKAYHNYKFW